MEYDYGHDQDLIAHISSQFANEDEDDCLKQFGLHDTHKMLTAVASQTATEADCDVVIAAFSELECYLRLLRHEFDELVKDTLQNRRRLAEHDARKASENASGVGCSVGIIGLGAVAYGLYRLYAGGMLSLQACFVLAMIYCVASSVSYAMYISKWENRQHPAGCDAGFKAAADAVYSRKIGSAFTDFAAKRGDYFKLWQLASALKDRLHSERMAPFAAFALDWSNVGHMTNAEHLDIVCKQATTIQLLLNQVFCSVGERLHADLDQVKDRLPEEIVRKARYVATMRNRLVHEYECRGVPDIARFIRISQSVLQHLIALPGREARDAFNDMIASRKESLPKYVEQFQLRDKELQKRADYVASEWDIEKALSVHGYSRSMELIDEYEDVVSGLDEEWTELESQIKNGEVTSSEDHRIQLQFIVDASKHVEQILRRRFGAQEGIGLKTALSNAKFLHDRGIRKMIAEMGTIRNEFLHGTLDVSSNPEWFVSFKTLAESISRHLHSTPPTDP